MRSPVDREYRVKINQASMLLLLLLSGGVMAQDGVTVTQAWSRAMPPGSATAAIYLQLRNNGAGSLSLLGGSVKFAETVEVHQIKHKDGMMRMRRLDILEIPADSAIEFSPGGYHLMMFGLSETPAAGQVFTVQLRFEDGMTFDVPVTVRGVAEE